MSFEKRVQALVGGWVNRETPKLLLFSAKWQDKSAPFGHVMATVGQSLLETNIILEKGKWLVKAEVVVKEIFLNFFMGAVRRINKSTKILVAEMECHTVIVSTYLFRLVVENKLNHGVWFPKMSQNIYLPSKMNKNIYIYIYI